MVRERDIDDILEDKVGKLRDRVDEKVEKFKETVEEARERYENVKEKFDDVRERGQEGWKDVVKFTQKHPAQALGVAIVIGAALGALLLGRNRD